jgi:hypothetical protein
VPTVSAAKVKPTTYYAAHIPAYRFAGSIELEAWSDPRDEKTLPEVTSVAWDASSIVPRRRRSYGIQDSDGDGFNGVISCIG